jgi:hypothetical protein
MENWFDYTLHLCANPRDTLVPVSPAIQRICEGLYETKDECLEKLEIPILLMNGELEIPRARMILS